MANPTWPVSLPRPDVNGISYSSPENVIRSSMDAPVAKLRRRFTAVPERVSFQLSLTEAQVQTLHDFAVVTLADVLPFDWVELRQLSVPKVATYRFVSRPKYSYQSFGYWRAEVELDLLTTLQGTHLLDVSPLST